MPPATHARPGLPPVNPSCCTAHAGPGSSSYRSSCSCSQLGMEFRLVDTWGRSLPALWLCSSNGAGAGCTGSSAPTVFKLQSRSVVSSWGQRQPAPRPLQRQCWGEPAFEVVDYSSSGLRPFCRPLAEPGANSIPGDSAGAQEPGRRDRRQRTRGAAAHGRL